MDGRDAHSAGNTPCGAHSDGCGRFLPSVASASGRRLVLQHGCPQLVGDHNLLLVSM